MTTYEASDLAVLILAAGKGTRMKSEIPKVLHHLGGQPLLAYTLRSARELAPGRIIVLVGHQGEMVREAFSGENDLIFVTQEPQLGTGHAVMTAAPSLRDWEGPILVLCGDVPGLKSSTLANLLAEHKKRENALTVLGMVLEDPKAYGRLLTQADQLIRIVEFRDASEQERKINLVNAGIYVFSAKPLLRALPGLSDNNDQREYYLTDLVEIMRGQGQRVGYAVCPDSAEVAGVNSKEELAELETILTMNNQG